MQQILLHYLNYMLPNLKANMKKLLLLLLMLHGALSVHADPNRNPERRAPAQRSTRQGLYYAAAAVGAFAGSYRAFEAVRIYFPQQAKTATTPAHKATIVAFNSCLLAGSAIGLYWGSKMAYWSIKSFLGKS